jgi:uridine kinase
MELDKVYEIILDRVATINKSGPIRIAINGIEGTGKTIFADRLTQYCNRKNFHAIHVSIDGFHYNKAHRHKKGNDSAIGYYEDAYDEQTFINKVLRASQNEFPTYIPSSHDLNTDKYLDIEPISIYSSQSTEHIGI